MELIRMAVAGLKKKNSMFTFSLLILFAVMLLESGIFLLFSIPRYYKDSNQRLNAPDYVVRMNDNMYQNSFLSYMQQDTRVKKAEAISVIMMNNANYRTENGKMNVYASFLNAQDCGEMFALSPLYEDTSIPIEKSLYVPLAFYQQGYRTGDSVSFEFQKKQYDFTISGFFETTWFGSSSSPLYNYYLNPETYESIYREIGGGKLLNIQMENGYSVAEVTEDFKEVTGAEFDAYSQDALTMEFTAKQMESSNTIMITIISAVSILFAVLLLGIILLVLWFRIVNQIQENLKHFGVMLALGYSGAQIRMTIVLEHFFASVPGALLGVAGAYGFLALLGNLISGSLGILYRSTFHLGMDAIGLLIVWGIIFTVSYLAAGSVKKLTPVEAFRQGKKAHIFRTSIFSLSEGNGGMGSIHTKLSLKSVCYAPRTYITLAGILIGVTIILSFSLILYENLGKNESGFIRLMGSEACDVMVELSPHVDYASLQKELETMQGVESTALFESCTMVVEGIQVSMNVAADFDALKTYQVYDGSFPRYENEVVLSGVVASQLGKKIGDWVEVSKNGVTAEYIICGMVQSMSNFGMQGAMKLEGTRRIDTAYQFSSIYVYLQEGMNYERFIQLLEEKYPMSKLDDELASIMKMYGIDGMQYALMVDGEVITSGDSNNFRIDNTQDMKSMILTATASYMVMIKTLSIFLMVLSAAVTTLILHLMVKSSINKRKQEFGTLKAMGYTSSGLMFQIAIAYLPVSVPGVLIGCLAGAYLTGPMVTAITSSLGVSDISFQISTVSLFLLGSGILAFLFLNAWIAARRVKKIAVYELFTE